MNKKEQILTGLRAFARQRSGMDCRNYDSVASYRAEARQITRDLQDATLLLCAVAWRDSITADDLLAAAESAYSGRLSITVTPHQYFAADCPGNPCGSDCDHAGAPWTVAIDYCTGQYFPTEYRKAVCAILASALWANVRDSIPNEGRDGKSPGELIRAYFRTEFGRRIAARYFD